MKRAILAASLLVAWSALPVYGQPDTRPTATGDRQHGPLWQKLRAIEPIGAIHRGDVKLADATDGVLEAFKRATGSEIATVQRRTTQELLDKQTLENVQNPDQSEAARQAVLAKAKGLLEHTVRCENENRLTALIEPKWLLTGSVRIRNLASGETVYQSAEVKAGGQETLKAAVQSYVEAMADRLRVDIVSGAAASPQPVVRPPIERYLAEGKLAEGEAAMKAALAANPADDQARFSLGVVQVLRAVERRVQQLMRFGIRTDVAPIMPGVRLPIPPNAACEEMTYQKLRAIIQEFVTELDAASATLAAVKDTNVKLPLRVGLIRLDVNGDGAASEEEALWHAMELLNGSAYDIAGGDYGQDQWIDEYERQVTSGEMDEKQQQAALAEIARMRAESAARLADRQEAARQRRKQLEQRAQEFVICFDYADVQWLIGYTNLLSALGEIGLSFDSRELFDHAAHLVFPKVKTPYPFLKDSSPSQYGFSPEPICDAIVAVHLVNFPIAEPKRLGRALEHFQTVIAQSRRMWKAIDAETDDDHEWIHGPKQTGVMPGAPRVTEEMRQGWDQFLDELDAILAGKTLVPHWRVRDGRGINLRSVFTDPPKRFDAVLWVQGSDAAPYLEKGPLSQMATWERINSLMNGQLGVFAAWWN